MTAAAALALLALVVSSFTGTPALAGTPAAPAAAAPDYNFTSPVNASQRNGIHPGVIGAMLDGSVQIPYLDGTNTELDDSYNHSFLGGFSQQSLDHSSSLVGNIRMVSDTHGRIHMAWFHNFSNGTTQIYYGRKEAGSASQWQIMAIPGSDSGSSTGGGYKVVGIARGINDRIYVMWARNGVGARVAYTDNGTDWSPVDVVPGPFDNLSTDFNIGATTSGYVFVGWFERAPNDIFVEMKGPADGTWSERTDVTDRPDNGQDYSPRFGTAPDGSLHLLWTGVCGGCGEGDLYYRTWSPAGGWNPDIIQLFQDSGNGNSRAAEIVVDSAGQDHIVWDDDTGRSQNNVTTYYIRGSGENFSSPQQVYPGFGNATSRYPYVDVGPVPSGQLKVHIVTNSNVGGGFDNYYTTTDAGAVAGTPLPTDTPTPGVCTPNNFTDVSTDNPFYRYIHDLAVRGAISGYSDCTFRPVNNITRAQIAKVILLAFGYQMSSPPNPDFTDVPYGAPFYDVIETAYLNGIISGYTCGGPNEPCDAQHHPYFRPNTNVTRGQIAKMVVIAKHWIQVNPPAPGDFTDVPYGSPFYQVIETAYRHGVISGYSDHTFRPGNSATRGQASKIVDLSIYSNDPTATPTATAVPPTATAVPPTETSVPTTPTETSVPGTPTETSVPVTVTVTTTPLAVTATATQVLPTVTIAIPTVTVTLPPPPRAKVGP